MGIPLGTGIPLGMGILGIIPLGGGIIPPGAGIPLGMGIPLGIGIPLGMGIPLGAGIPLGFGISGIILSAGICMPQHMPPGFGAAGGGGLSGCGADAVAGRTVNIPEAPTQVPARNVATAIQPTAKTAAITRLRWRRLLPSPLKNPIVDSSRAKRRVPVQHMTSPTGARPVYYLTT